MNIITTYFKVRPLKGAVSLGTAAMDSSSDAAVVARQSEYLECLSRNCQHPEVERVHVLVEGEEAYQHLVQHVLDPTLSQLSSSSGSVRVLSRAERRKIVPLLRLHPFMPVYADLFCHANLFAQGCLCMICNADVFLSPTHFSVAAAQQLFDRSDRRLALALTRYESDDFSDAPLIKDYRGSHDAFVLVPPVPDTFLVNVMHPQNCYQAENVVIHELQQNGYEVVNPCLDLRLVHRHAADVRQWFPSVDSTRYGRAAPVTLSEATAKLLSA